MSNIKEEILEGNKLIAQFRGYEYIPFNNDKGLEAGWWTKGITKEQQQWEASARKVSKGRLLCRQHTYLRYFNEWDALMPVIRTIEELDLKDIFYTWERMDGKKEYNFMCMEVDIDSSGCWIYADLTLDPPMDLGYCKADRDDINGKIKAVFRAVVQFIKWYNERNK